MKNISLSKIEIEKLVFDNRYKIDEKEKSFSRCIDDRYQEDLGLSPLAMPGADVGQLAVFFATANSYGLYIDYEKAYSTLIEVIGGEHNFHFHTDNHHSLRNPAAGCGYFKEINLNPEAYNLKKEDVKFIKDKLNLLLKEGVEEEVLFGEHLIGAILQIKGKYNIYPCYVLGDSVVKQRVEFLLFHQTLVYERHRILSKKLIENKAIKLYDGCDEEYLFEIMSETADSHFEQTIKKLAKGVMIYKIKFEADGNFEVTEIERV